VVGISVELLRAPSRYGDLQVRNPSQYSVVVELSAPRDGWLSIGSVPPFSRATFHDILDLGPVWVTRFRTQGRAEEITLPRPSTEPQAKTIELPAEIIARWHAAGVPASPCFRDDCPPAK
jgi:hypothetical protein